MEADLIAELAPAIHRSPVPVVIDHMGRVDASRGLDQPAFQRAARAARRQQCLGEGQRLPTASPRQGPPYADAVPFARKLVAEFGDRAVWGTDWPHPNHQGPIPDDGHAGRSHRRDRAGERGAAGAAGRQPAAFLSISALTQGVSTMTGRLQDKVAIVTGAGCVGPGWGNGRATAVRFAEEGAKIFARRPQSRRAPPRRSSA